MALSPAERQARIATLATALEDAKAEAKLWAEEVDRIQGLLIGMMQTNTTAVKVPGGDTLKVTRVQGSRVVTDPAKLKSRLRADQWKLVTDQVLSKAKLEAAMTTGQVDPVIVASCSDDKPSKPYVLITRTKSGGQRASNRRKTT